MWCEQTHTRTDRPRTAPLFCLSLVTHSVHIKACAVGLHVTADRCGDRGDLPATVAHVTLLLGTWYTRAVTICMGKYLLTYLLT